MSHLQTKEEFIKGYCERSGITEGQLYNEFNQIVLPCDCGDADCVGWAAFNNTERNMKSYKDIYNFQNIDIDKIVIDHNKSLCQI